MTEQHAAAPHVAELWDTAGAMKLSPDEHCARYEMVRLGLSMGGRKITREEVLSWPPIDHVITWGEILAEAGPIPPTRKG
jgi:hypothetical protein